LCLFGFSGFKMYDFFFKEYNNFKIKLMKTRFLKVQLSV
jgi:hypothetical protein